MFADVGNFDILDMHSYTTRFLVLGDEIARDGDLQA